jgi:hypothetical protein
VVFALVIVVSVFGFLLRLMGALIIGVGAVAVGGAGLFVALAGGAVVIGFALILAHVLLPILVIAGIVWLIHRSGKPPAAPPIAHG